MAKTFRLIPITTKTFTVECDISRKIANQNLRQHPIIRNTSCRITSEIKTGWELIGLRGMYFPNTDPQSDWLQSDLTERIKCALGDDVLVRFD